MKAYIDADILLDIILNRTKFVEESAKVLQLCEKKMVDGCTTALALANIYYILRKLDLKKAKLALNKLREILSPLPITDEEIEKSLNSKFKDFEDGIQNFAAVKGHCKVIVTRNHKDFKASTLTVYSPKELLLQFVE